MNISCQEQCPPRSSPAVPPLPPSALQQWAGVGTEPRKKRWNFHCCQEKETWNSTFAFAYLYCKQKWPQINSRCYFSANLFVCHSRQSQPEEFGHSLDFGCGALSVTALCQLLLRKRQHSPAIPRNNVKSYLIFSIKKIKISHPEVSWKVCVL